MNEVADGSRVDTLAGETSVDGAGASASVAPRGWRLLFLRLHFYAGVTIAPFLVIAAVSGGLYAIAPTLEQIVYRGVLHTDSVGPARPVAQQVDAAVAYQPDLTLVAVRPAVTSGDTTRVMFSDPALGSSSKRVAVFVDPVTARAVGQNVVYGSSSSLPLRTWISELHRTLHLGEPGRLYSELAASWLWVITLSGAYLWINRYRRGRTSRRHGDNSARLVTLDRSATGRRRTLNWHGVTGIWIAAGLVFLSATGLTWSTYAGDSIASLRSTMSWTTPVIDTSIPAGAKPTDDHAAHHQRHAETEAHGTALNRQISQIDGVLSTARKNGVNGAVEVTVPARGDAAFVVTQTRQPWRMSNDAIAIDGKTDAVVDTLRFADWPLAAKLSAWGIQLHMGTLFGIANQLTLLALAIALVTVIARGYVMWWKRRPTQPKRYVGSPPHRGGLREIPLSAAIVLAALTLVAGWLVPLLVLSLCAFLACDIALRAIQQRRAAQTH